MEILCFQFCRLFSFYGGNVQILERFVYILQNLCKLCKKKTFTRKIATFHRHFMRSESETCVKMYRLYIEFSKSRALCANLKRL